MTAQVATLPDGRLHLHHGPMDVILTVEGPGAEAGRARAVARFGGLLDELVAELPALRLPAQPGRSFSSPVARAMHAAVLPHLPAFITPMAAVAGAGAEALVQAARGPGVTRVIANNGGDIALGLGPNQSVTVALAAMPGSCVRIAAGDGVAGLATSGWRGRSHSLGIADAVTVIAASAPVADAAATMIANAVDLPGHPAIVRRPARELAPDSDLGDLLVTVDVGRLGPAERAAALARGAALARSLQERRVIAGACLTLGADHLTLGACPNPLPVPETRHA